LVAAAGGHGEHGGTDLICGDELLLSYGPRLAEELLHVYGFLPEPISETDVTTGKATAAEATGASGWDAAVLLVPCETSEDGEEEIELFGQTTLGRDPRLPSQQGWELIKVRAALCNRHKPVQHSVDFFCSSLHPVLWYTADGTSTLIAVQHTVP
jgi:hypothetical protein